jgi:hypothetical protein
MVNLIAFAVIAAIVGFAVGYIVKEKKRGARCIGCPDSGSCSANCSCCGGCHK